MGEGVREGREHMGAQKGARGQTHTRSTWKERGGGVKGKAQQLLQTHLPVLAFTTPCSRLKLRWGHDLISRGNDVEVLAALPQLQPPSQLLADDLHLTGHLWVPANDKA